MYIFLDDTRLPPPGWTLAPSMAHAIDLVRSEEPWVALSLDYDLSMACHLCDDIPCLGATCVTGLTFLEWMHRNNRWPMQRPIVHTEHERAKDMRRFIDHHFPGRRVQTLHLTRSHIPDSIEGV